MTTTQGPALKNHNTACPVIIVNDVEKEINFIENVFNAEVISRIMHPEGYLFQGRVKIRDSVIIIEKIKKGFPNMENIVYVFTKDIDDTYLLALEYEAESLVKPEKQYDGVKEAKLKDTQGVYWRIAEVVEEPDTETIEKNLKESLGD